MCAHGSPENTPTQSRLNNISYLFQSQRLGFRRWTADDLEAIYELYSHADVIPFIGDGDPITREDTHLWLEVTNANFEKRGYGMIAMFELATDQMVGCIGIVHPGQQPEAEVKYALFKTFWGMGFATETVQAIVQHARSEWSVQDVIATVHPDNLGSMSVLTKAGFTREPDRIEEDGTPTVIFKNKKSAS
ncbi:MAG TPA: GNAT family N-acetyltransferase [Fimbriimonas sp.]|nr:GNAT family N-acetyltransferase [Fimbriimonas sp.]